MLTKEKSIKFYEVLRAKDFRLPDRFGEVRK